MQSPTDNPAHLIYGTFLGATDYQYDFGIAVDEVGYAYVTGRTSSNYFPTTPDALDTICNGSYDTFVLRLAMGSEHNHCLYLPGVLRQAP